MMSPQINQVKDISKFKYANGQKLIPLNNNQNKNVIKSPVKRPINDVKKIYLTDLVIL